MAADAFREGHRPAWRTGMGAGVVTLGALLLMALFLGRSLKNRSDSPRQEDGLTFERTVWDACDVFIDDARSFTFPFVNRGVRPVEIADIVSSCTCVNVEADPKVVASSQKGTIHGKVIFTGRMGPMEDRLAVKTTGGHVQVLRIRANVRPYYAVEPASVNFGDVWWDQRLDATVHIRSLVRTGPQELLTIAPGHHHCIAAEIDRSAEKDYALHIMVRDPEIGYLHQRVLVKTSHPGQPDIFIPVLARVKGPISVTPERLFLGKIEAQKTLARRFLVTRRSHSPVQIHGLSASQIGVTIAAEQPWREDAMTFDVELTFSGLSGLVSDTIRMEASPPGWTIHIPVVVQVGD